MGRRKFLKGIASVALLSGCLSSSERISVQNKEMRVLGSECVEEAHESADVIFEKSKEAISISGIASLDSEDERLTASVFTTRGGDGASGNDSIIVRLSPKGGTDSGSTDGDCVPIREYNLQLQFDRMPIDVLVDHETRASEESGFIAHAKYDASEAGS